MPAAMKLFQRLLLLFLLVVLPLEAFLYTQYRPLLGDRNTEYLSALQKPGQQTRVLVVGDSHPGNAFKFVKLPDSMATLAYGMESLKEVYLKLNYLAEKGVTPRVLLVQLDYHVFSTYYDATSNELDMAQVAPPAVYNEVYDRDLTHLKQWGLQLYPLIDLRNRNMLLSLLLAKLGSRTNAAALKPGQWQELDAAARRQVAADRAAALYSNDGRFRASEEMLKMYARICDFCRARNIRMVGIRYPHTDEFLAFLEPYDLSRIDRFLQEQGPEQVLDYTRIFQGQPQYFQDSDHVNEEGSRLLYRQFAQDFARLGNTGAAARVLP